MKHGLKLWLFVILLALTGCSNRDVPANLTAQGGDEQKEQASPEPEEGAMPEQEHGWDINTDPSLGFSTMILWKQLNTQYIDSQHSCWLFSFFNT